MKILNYIFFAILFTLVSTSCNDFKSTSLPNIVLINVDDLGYMDTGLYGNDDFSTPHINSLAQNGMLFTRAYASAANCAPSRACLLSGQQTTRHGIYTVGSSQRGKSIHRQLIPTVNTLFLTDSMLTIAEALQSIGYSTCHIGKFHVGKDPLTQGFDHNIGGTEAGNPKTYFSPYRNPKLSDGPQGEYLTDRLTSEAINYMSQDSSPFFLYLSYFAVHTPLQGKPELVDTYLARGFSPKTARYAAMVDNMDRNIGRLVAKLKKENVWENTILIFTSDNGGIAQIHSQHPLRAGKGSYYEGGTRVPLLFSWPGKIKANSSSDQLVSNLDFFPTLFGLIKKPLPKDKILDGLDVSNVLLGNEEMIERDLYWHFPIYLQAYAGAADESRDDWFRTRPGSTLVSWPWKLHHYYEYNEYELYNLEVDPTERNNLQKIEVEVLNGMKNKLDGWLSSNKAPIPKELNPDYVPH